jgi:hypothetical protein
MGAEGRTADRVIARIAGAGHGVIARDELLAAGVSRREIQRRVERGALIRVHRGVYRAGHTAPSREATYLAAVEACGPGSLLAGKAAAHLWGSLRGKPPPPEVLTASERRVPVVTVRRARRTSAAARPRAALSSGAAPPPLSLLVSVPPRLTVPGFVPRPLSVPGIGPPPLSVPGFGPPRLSTPPSTAASRSRRSRGRLWISLPHCRSPT